MGMSHMQNLVEPSYTHWKSYTKNHSWSHNDEITWWHRHRMILNHTDYGIMHSVICRPQCLNFSTINILNQIILSELSCIL
jgi:hypothetical protein